jgi:hypothetical protein
MAPSDDHPTRRIGYVGATLLGPVFLAGSIVALWYRKRAGLTFLIPMPFIVFCLAYPSAGYLVWRSDGGWFELPEIPTAVGLSILFFAVVFAGLATLHRKKWAIPLLLATLVIASVVFSISRWTKVFLAFFGGFSALFLLFGLFWFETGHRSWPSLFKPRSHSLRHRALVFVLLCMLILCVDVFLTLGLSALGSSLFSGDCRGKPIFVRPESPYHAVFTAKVVYVGRSMEALLDGRGIFREPRFSESHDPHVGDWAIGIVQEEFWGLPSWTRLVLLKDFIYRKDETYYLDGSRERGLLARELPIVSGRINCSRTRLARDAFEDITAIRQARGRR